MSQRLLVTLRPALRMMPYVQKSKKQISFRRKLIWTGVTLFIYLICSQIPIFGIVNQSSGDPFYWMRVVLASNKGTLMELGISPSITAGMISQLLVGTRLISVDMKVEEERFQVKQAEKLLALIICICESLAYVWSGSYGSLEEIGPAIALLIVIQLSGATLVTMLLDDINNGGYGLGSGTSLFIATNICEMIVWKSFSPITIKTGGKTEFEGCIVSAVHKMFTSRDYLTGFNQVMFRKGAPNLNSLLATIFIFLIVIYFQGFRKDIKCVNINQRGYTYNHSIKLFYTSNIPIIFVSSLIQNSYFMSQILARKYKGNWFVDLIGVWQEDIDGFRSFPISGLAYYISQPRSASDIINDPIQVLTYVTFMLTSCALFSKFWIQISQQSSYHVAQMLKDNNMKIAGHDRSMIHELERYIPIAAAFGGICVGLLTILADFLGAIGSGTGILLAVTIIYGYMEAIQKQKSPNQM